MSIGRRGSTQDRLSNGWGVDAMQQQINLFVAEFRAEAKSFGAVTLLYAAAAVLVALSLTYAFPHSLSFSPCLRVSLSLSLSLLLRSFSFY